MKNLIFSAARVLHDPTLNTGRFEDLKEVTIFPIKQALDLY